MGALRDAAVLLAVMVPLQARAALPPAQLTRAIDATVFIKVERFFQNQSLPTFGSGFFVDGRGHVMTNWHVVAPQIELSFDGRDSEVSTTIGAINVVIDSGRPNERTVPAKVVRLDRARDLALLEVQVSPRAWLDVSAPPDVALTDAVLAVGYPFGELLALNKKNPEVTVSRGHTTSIRHGERGEVEAFQLDAAINPGNSGGPVLNEQGAVVGVAWAGVSGGTGTALAIAPGRLRAFSDEIQFDVRVTPPAVYERRQPLLVEVFPLLRGIAGLKGRVALSGPDIEPAVQELNVRQTSLTCQIAVPQPAKAAGKPASYSLMLQLTDAAGKVAFRHSWAIPVREGQVAGVSPPRPAANVMRDRQDFPNAADSGDTRMATGLDGQTSRGKDAGRSPLSQLASGVKLRSSSEQKGIVVTNSNLGTVGFVVNEARYAALPTDLRSLAIEFDRAEFHLRGFSAGFTDASGSFTNESYPTRSASSSSTSRMQRRLDSAGAASSTGDDSSARRAEAARAKAAAEAYRSNVAQDVSNARANVEAARAKVVTAGLCRCPDKTWFRMADKASCERCVSP